MKAASFLLVLTLALAGCPHNGAGPVGPNASNPYNTARSVVQIAQLSLLVSDGIMDAWAIAQTDPAKVVVAKATYAGVRAAVVSGLRLALDAIAIAEQVQKPLDLPVLLVQVEAAWKDLRLLIANLVWQPSSRPMATAPGKYSGFRLDELPPALLPVR